MSAVVPRPPALALLLVWWPALFVAGVAVVAGLPWWTEIPGWQAALAASVTWFLVPPLIGRCLLPAVRGEHEIPFASPRGLAWFALLQLQLPFQRLPFCEELLRLVPGLYQLWLRLWGSRVAWTSVWNPGVVVADRWGLEVGPAAVIGARAHLGAHVLVPGADGPRLSIAPLRIGAGSVVGALCAVGPGAVLDDGAVLPATRPLPPYCRISVDGRRRRRGEAERG